METDLSMPDGRPTRLVENPRNRNPLPGIIAGPPEILST